MKLQINSVRFDAAPALLDFVQRKCDKLETFSDKIIDGEVYLKTENADDPKEEKIAEVKINLPGNTLFSSEKHDSFEGATDLAVEAIRRQLIKAKEKMMNR
jgi:putative sigma-54 modulation protein